MSRIRANIRRSSGEVITERQSKSAVITIGELENSVVFCAGVKQDGDAMLTSGGRVLGVIDTADTLEDAIKKAYSNVAKISFEGEYHRSDIGKRALAAYNK